MVVPYQLHHQHQNQKQTNQHHQIGQSLSSSNFDFKILQKPFWIWNQSEHLETAKISDGQCCWNHIVGLPVKDLTSNNGNSNSIGFGMGTNRTRRKEYPLFDYENMLPVQRGGPYTRATVRKIDGIIDLDLQTNKDHPNQSYP